MSALYYWYILFRHYIVMTAYSQESRHLLLLFVYMTLRAWHYEDTPERLRATSAKTDAQRH